MVKYTIGQLHLLSSLQLAIFILLSSCQAHSWSAKQCATFDHLTRITFSKKSPDLETLVLSNTFDIPLLRSSYMVQAEPERHAQPLLQQGARPPPTSASFSL